MSKKDENSLLKNIKTSSRGIKEPGLFRRAFAGFGRFVWNHKILTILVTVGLVTLGALLPSIIGGTLATAFALEGMAIGLGVGLAEVAVFVIARIRLEILKQKELKLAQKLIKNQTAKKKLKTSKKALLSKKFIKVHYQLAKFQAEYDPKKATSLLLPNLKMGKKKHLINKYWKLKAERAKKQLDPSHNAKAIARLENKIRVIDEELKLGETVGRAGLVWNMEVPLEIEDNSDLDNIKIRKTRIECHNKKTQDRFSTLCIEKENYSKDEIETSVIANFSKDSQIFPVKISYVNSKLDAPILAVLYDEIKSVSESNPDKPIFPVTIRYITGKREGKEIVINNDKNLDERNLKSAKVLASVDKIANKNDDEFDNLAQ